MRDVRLNLFTRVLAVLLLAGAVTLAASTATVVLLVADDKEAGLTDSALVETERRRDALAHRLELARSQLNTVALGTSTGHAGAIPDYVGGTVNALVVRQDQIEVVAAAESREQEDRLRLSMSGDHAPLALVGKDLVLDMQVHGFEMVALVKTRDLLTVPIGWSARLVAVSPGEATAGTVAHVDVDRIRVVAPVNNIVGVRLVAPLTPARTAALAISHSVVWWSLLVFAPLFVLAWLLSRHVTAPIRSLVAAVRRSRGQPIELLALPNDEVGELGAEIAAMSERLHRDASALRRALKLGRDSTESIPEFLDSLEAALGAVAGEWRVRRADWASSRVSASPVGLAEGAPPAGWRATSFATAAIGDGYALADEEQVYGWVVAPTSATDEDLRIAEVLVQTALGTLRSARLARQAQVGEKLAMLGRLSASVAHEMNTPLAFVKANLNALNLEDLNSDCTEMLADARIGVERLVCIVRDLSAVSGEGRDVSSERFLLGPLVWDMARMARSRRPLGHVSIDVSGDLEIEADRGRLQQVVLNLLNNALDAVGSGGTVEVSARRIADVVTLDVKDDGPGIPESMQGRLFEAFRTSKGEQGTGLGLYISRSFVEAHGGSLELVSTGTTGTLFRVRLPHAASGLRPPSLAPPAESASGPPPGRPRILVIDDDPAVVRGMRRWLRTRADVEGTVDGKQALELMRNQTFDLILCDLDMPALSGSEIVRELRDEPELLERLVIVTGATGHTHGDLRVVQKPIDGAQLDLLLASSMRQGAAA